MVCNAPVRRWVTVVIGTAIALLLYAGQLDGQVLYGSIVGNVLDPSGAPVPGAIVKVINNDTGRVRETLTNDVGAYSFPTVFSGSFYITVVKNGFQTATKTGVPVTINS